MDPRAQPGPSVLTARTEGTQGPPPPAQVARRAPCPACRAEPSGSRPDRAWAARSSAEAERPGKASGLDQQCPRPHDCKSTRWPGLARARHSPISSRLRLISPNPAPILPNAGQACAEPSGCPGPPPRGLRPPCSPPARQGQLSHQNVQRKQPGPVLLSILNSVN